ncbi:MAG: 16S rRNA (adenine(1518)-N(6)/adenine(1519)-N(6))-dimethyltransferase RsmA [Verrucomicrobiia bacterium]|jgi:16S rRNA (adenine1518-N6/adenine1519-N6)-dimethyltransferase
MTISEIKRLLAEYDIRLSKRLGQNFLHDANQLRKIVSAAQLKPADKVIEIGPGLGPLTELLVHKAKYILAIEKDERLVQILNKKFADIENLKIINDDALLYLIKNNDQDFSQWVVVSNLPYSVASPILVEFAKFAFPPQRIVVTIQSEVADRIVALPSQPDYGLLTLFVQLRYIPVYCFKIPPSCFFPEPKVDSACLRLVRREEEFLNTQNQRELFYKIVSRAFSQRRKMMFKLLKSDFPPELLKEAFLSNSISLESRGESVSLEQFVGLTKFIFSRINLTV